MLGYNDVISIVTNVYYFVEFSSMRSISIINLEVSVIMVSIYDVYYYNLPASTLEIGSVTQLWAPAIGRPLIGFL